MFASAIRFVCIAVGGISAAAGAWWRAVPAVLVCWFVPGGPDVYGDGTVGPKCLDYEKQAPDSEE